MRISPELHKQAVIYAQGSQKSLNSFVGGGHSRLCGKERNLIQDIWQVLMALQPYDSRLPSERAFLDQRKRYDMKKEKLGLGSISLLLVIVAVLWSYNISGYCLGDQVLHALNLSAWSNEAATPDQTLSIVPFGHQAQRCALHRILCTDSACTGVSACHKEQRPSVRQSWKVDLADSHFAAADQPAVYDSLIIDCRERNSICTKRMLDKQNEPTIAEMTAYCGENGELFAFVE